MSFSLVTILEYQLVRSNRRKTIALQVKNAKIIVRAPQHVATEYIDNLIRLKSAWLKSKVSQQQSAADSPVNNPDHNFSANSVVRVDGVMHNIIVCFGKQRVLHDSEKKVLRVFLAPKYRQYEAKSAVIATKVKQLIEQWFTLAMREYLSDTVPMYSVQTSLYAKSFKVRKYKARWGSCNNRGELSFNCLLKMVPPWVVDYVVIHELCHLKHMNHSTNFWQLVEKHLPDFRLAKNWLKEHQTSLSWN